MSSPLSEMVWVIALEWQTGKTLNNGHASSYWQHSPSYGWCSRSMPSPPPQTQPASPTWPTVRGSCAEKVKTRGEKTSSTMTSQSVPGLKQDTKIARVLRWAHKIILDFCWAVKLYGAQCKEIDKADYAEFFTQQTAESVIRSFFSVLSFRASDIYSVLCLSCVCYFLRALSKWLQFQCAIHILVCHPQIWYDQIHTGHLPPRRCV